MKFPLYPEHAEEEKAFFLYMCKRNIVFDSANLLRIFGIIELPFHSESVEEEEYVFIMYNKVPLPS